MTAPRSTSFSAPPFEPDATATARRPPGPDPRRAPNSRQLAAPTTPESIERAAAERKRHRARVTELLGELRNMPKDSRERAKLAREVKSIETRIAALSGWMSRETKRRTPRDVRLAERTEREAIIQSLLDVIDRAEDSGFVLTIEETAELDRAAVFLEKQRRSAVKSQGGPQ